jgi:hypothetical protein
MAVAIVAVIVIQKEFPHAAQASDKSGRLNSGALALAAAGIGAFAGAVTAPFVGRTFKKAGMITLGFVISGTGILALGGVVSIPAVLGLTFIGGYGGFVAKVAVDAQVQEALPDDYRGRAFALYDILYNLASVVAAAIILGFQSVPIRPMLIAFGAVTLGVAAVMAKAMTAAGMEFRAAPTPRIPVETNGS